MEHLNLLQAIRDHIKTKNFTSSHGYFDKDWSILLEPFLLINNKNGDMRMIRHIPRVRIHDSLIKTFSQIKEVHLEKTDVPNPYFYQYHYTLRIMLVDSEVEKIRNNYEIWERNLLTEVRGTVGV